MGEVYKDIGQEPIRLTIRVDDKLAGICFGHIVNARRGRHYPFLTTGTGSQSPLPNN